jgi:endoribonuclease LACTB2
MTEQMTPNISRLEYPSRTLPPFSHTNSYLIYSDGNAALVDPGFYSQASLEHLLQTLESTNNHLTSILLTHTHPDHQEGIALIENILDIPVFVHKLEQYRAKAKRLQLLEENFVLGDLKLEVLFTPGHSPGHVSFYLPSKEIALVGDVVAGYGSTWIGLPDGNYNDYFRSLELLNSLKLTCLAPGHGPIIAHPYKKLKEVKQHRLRRLEQVYKALEKEHHLDALCLEVYPELSPEMEAAAKGSLLALLAKLQEDDVIENLGQNWQGPYQRTTPNKDDFFT